MEDFVDGWAIVQTLGEGAYGEVKLLVNKENGDLIAMKMVDVKKHPEAKLSTQKEIAIHQQLKDTKIIKFLGYRQHKDMYYLFLEYAHHGELFELIEPDVGMGLQEAQKYTRQLCGGVGYLHSLGIAHRDLKPENLLLDCHDNLKISDFGLSTMFRINGKERQLNKMCGTRPYCAPEVLQGPYAAEPADIWSIGIILTVMLGGELPWDEPSVSDPSFKQWINGKFGKISPWNKIDSISLVLIRRILSVSPSFRLTLSQIKRDQWFTMEKIQDHCSDTNGFNVGVSTHSQPCERLKSLFDDQLRYHEPNPHIAFSQPVQPNDMILSTQGSLTQSSSPQNPWQKLIKRMTRFFVSMLPEHIFSELTLVLDKLGLPWKVITPRTINIETSDRRKNQLVFKVYIVAMETNRTLLDFRLSKGCGLDFKRLFITIKDSLSLFVTSAPAIDLEQT